MTANNAPSNIRPAGMDSASSHSANSNNGVGNSPGCVGACSAEESSAAQPGAATQRRCYKSSSAPFMTNPNYRIIPPSPGPDSASDRPSGFSQPGTATAAASARTSAWLPPTVAETGVDGSMGDAMQIDDAQELRTEYDVLPYEVHTWSSHSANFMPHNILSDRPHDQASRWATNANNHRQFITLRLERPALVPHVCNLKEFKVYGGMTQENMVEILYSGLRNDSEAETISLKQRVHGHYLPCQYIKIQPLLAHDQKFNFSIWYVELRGTMEPQIMQRITADFNRLREQEVIRSCLKFFRDRSLDGAFNTLQQQTSVSLEAPVLANIYSALVEQADYCQTEQLLLQAERDGVFASCMSSIPYASVWKQVDQSAYHIPTARGGHQMCVDEESRVAYLFGGWDGANNLGDLWMLCMDTGKWTCLSANTRNEGGPGPRSCHAMCFDSVHKCIYIMGKYVDHEYRGNTGLENDLFCYDTLNNEWLVLSENTEVLDGPMLVFNSQMVFDPIHLCIYVYGGKVVQPDINDSRIVYSGLYRFELRRHRWTKLKHDSHLLEQEHHVRGRYFHSMIIDPRLQRIYILSTKRDVSVPGDLLIYDIATNTFFEKMADLTACSSDKQPLTQQRYLSEKQRLNPMYPALLKMPPLSLPDVVDPHPHHVHLMQDGRTIRTSLDVERQELYVLASSQSEASPPTSGLLQQSLLAMRGARDLPCNMHEQSGAGLTYTGSSYSHLADSGFRPCSNLMDSGIRYEPGRFAMSGSGSESVAAGQEASKGGRSAASKSTTAGGQRRYEPSGDHIQMVVFCYHIPTETWTEVHNSVRAAALFAADLGQCTSAMLEDQGTAASSDMRYIDASGSAPPFPSPRYAQDWVYDRTTRRHYMFGGNPNRPNDKSARFNDTWELQLGRPTSQDILRRTLYLVRQRRFLDMCAGIRAASPVLESASVCGALPDMDDAVDEYKASAIPSPNSTLLDSSEHSVPPVKRLSPRLTDDQSADSQSQRQRLSDSSLPSRGMARSSNPLSMPVFMHPAQPMSDSQQPSGSGNDSTAWALSYLQQCVAPLVNHDDVGECQSFHALSTALFQISAGCLGAENSGMAEQHSPESLRRARADVYEALLAYFPEQQQQPSSRLDDIVLSELE
ncbi:hypothetical protein LPJ60_003870 [Coemansia sp. RSA 2675]|nr:hypothetical protein LPJ60_003870 [Coemansia sp. RSA 2675]